MNLTLRREPFSAKSIKGELFVDEVFTCYCLERPEDDPEAKPIPAGTYEVQVSYSPHFDKNLPHILNVPGRTAILMHGGNKPEDSLGCILCGYNEQGTDGIGDAAAIADLTRLMQAAIARGEKIMLTIVEP